MIDSCISGVLSTNSKVVPMYYSILVVFMSLLKVVLLLEEDIRDHVYPKRLGNIMVFPFCVVSPIEENPTRSDRLQVPFQLLGYR